MRSRWTVAWMAFALLGLAPSVGGAENVQEQVRRMQDRLQQMEDSLQAADDQLDAANTRVDEQNELLRSSGLADTRGASSGLGCLMCELTIGGWISGTYFYNLNDPQDADFDGLGGTNQGANEAFYPYHPDHNSFALDQIWWEIEREIDETNRAGFRLDTVYGKTAAMLEGPNNRENRDDSAFYILQAYVQYLAPIGDGVTFQFGKFGTPIGNEYAQTTFNWNITHGSVFELLEPLDHIGILASYAFGDTGFDAAIGGVNGFFPDDPDRNDRKSIVGHLGWENETISLGVNGMWGGEQTAFDGDESGIVNGVFTIDATERLAFWINGDYAWIEDPDGAAWGVAAAGRFAITERTGIALRGEYVADVDRYLGFVGFDPTGAFVAPTGIEVWGLTATVDHLLTDHLKIRGEVRYDNITKDNTPDDEFFEGSSNNGLELDDDQIVLGAEVIYNFNVFDGE